MQPVIELKNATIAKTIFGAEAAAIEEVNWQVSPGSFWVVGGLGNSGKSDLLLTIAGLAPLLAGEHYLFGQKLSDLDEDELIEKRLKVGLVFGEGGRLFSNLSLLENVALPLAYHQNRALEEVMTSAKEILQQFTMDSTGSQWPSDSPRHLRQRTALARAMALEPELLLIDNPFSGLDRAETLWWVETLERIRSGDKKRTIIVTTDDFEPWLGPGRSYAVIRNKRWELLEGTPSAPDLEGLLLAKR